MFHIDRNRYDFITFQLIDGMDSILVLIKALRLSPTCSTASWTVLTSPDASNFYLHRLNHSLGKDVFPDQIVAFLHKRPLLKDYCIRIVDIILDIPCKGNT